MKKYYLVLFIAGLTACQKTNTNNIAAPWEPDYKLNRSESSIVAFEKKDAEKMPAPGGIVFTGSSSFTKWQSAAEDLAPLPIINRGFGGSTLPEVIYYADRTITKYKPKTVVIYCENDMFGSKPKTPEQVRDAYVTLVKKIREKLPDVLIYGVSLKPSPSRWAKKDDVIKANKLIQDYIKTDKNHQYIDVWPVMLKNGRPDGSIFLSDSLHMNGEGYKRWTKVFKPILEKTV
ncbi:GDSL-type esterase/lipase family protein [Dyadobacter pollutisoli]|uniref:GDSL-type esterase/lipase family protein n=1 Tax=Dyadobacter pollutisoli TaxID=2910158 RepID=A0A9E8SMJ4_9BACT|nr:GDSL-type esterase/lipase family protein [Dyadobacter pollutisoli]WAC09857.1 GDSL-type esterase/lipase family protein [Dyadobacter pollutisoli]